MQTAPFLFFLESTGGLGNRQSQIATPLQRQGTALQAHVGMLVSPRHDGGFSRRELVVVVLLLGW